MLKLAHDLNTSFVVSLESVDCSARTHGHRSERFYFCRHGMPVPSGSAMGV
jgi:hypothetical protein